MAKDQRRSGRARAVCEMVIWCGVLGTVATVAICKFDQANDPRPIGHCLHQSAIGSVEQTVVEAIIAMGLNPNQVTGIHDAAIKSGLRLVSEGQPLQVCVTPDRSEVASVGGVNAGG